MRNFNFSDKLEKILFKLSRKDKQLYEQVLKKVQEVANSYEIEHYKNLKYDMKDCKRIHIGHFVLIFIYNKTNNTISFEDFDHHDNIYKKK